MSMNDLHTETVKISTMELEGGYIVIRVSHGDLVHEVMIHNESGLGMTANNLRELADILDSYA